METVITRETRRRGGIPDLSRDATIYYTGWGYGGSLPFGGKFGNGRGIYSSDGSMTSLVGAIATCKRAFETHDAGEERIIRKYGAVGDGHSSEGRDHLLERRVYLRIGGVYTGSTLQVDNLDDEETLKALAVAAHAAFKADRAGRIK